MNSHAPFAVTALVWSFRAVAWCAGAFVLLEWMTSRTRPVEFPPYNRIANARAWVCAAAGCLVGAASYILFDLYFISPRDGTWANVSVAVMWFFWAAALVQRSAARAEQPRFIGLSAAVIALGAFSVLVVGGRPEL